MIGPCHLCGWSRTWPRTLRADRRPLSNRKPDDWAEKSHRTSHRTVGHQAQPRALTVSHTPIGVVRGHSALNRPQGDAEPRFESCNGCATLLASRRGDSTVEPAATGPCARTASTPGIHRSAVSQSTSRSHTAPVGWPIVVSALNAVVISRSRRLSLPHARAAKAGKHWTDFTSCQERSRRTKLPPYGRRSSVGRLRTQRASRPCDAGSRGSDALGRTSPAPQPCRPTPLSRKRRSGQAADAFCRIRASVRGLSPTCPVNCLSRGP